MMYIYKSIYDVKKLWFFLKLKGKTQEYGRHTLFIKKRKKEETARLWKQFLQLPVTEQTPLITKGMELPFSTRS